MFNMIFTSYQMYNKKFNLYQKKKKNVSFISKYMHV